MVDLISEAQASGARLGARVSRARHLGSHHRALACWAVPRVGVHDVPGAATTRPVHERADIAAHACDSRIHDAPRDRAEPGVECSVACSPLQRGAADCAGSGNRTGSSGPSAKPQRARSTSCVNDEASLRPMRSTTRANAIPLFHLSAACTLPINVIRYPINDSVVCVPRHEGAVRGGSPRRFRSFQAQAERKLQMLDSAKDLNDLRVPPGNRLEKLGGERRGQHSIRINDQWRICSDGEMTAPGRRDRRLPLRKDMARNRMRPIHPGEILSEEFLVPLGMSAHALSQAIHVPATRVNDIVNRKRGVTADTALSLARYFGNSPEFWLNLRRRTICVSPKARQRPESSERCRRGRRHDVR